MEERYLIEIYSGGTYCGNAFFDTEEECIQWLKEDGFCDKGIIKDLETGKKRVVKVEVNLDLV